MLFPIGVDVPTDRRPWVNYLLIAAITVISVMALRDPELYRKLSGLELTGNEVEIGDIAFSQHTHRFEPDGIMYPVYAVTSCFVHGGFWHLFGNMLFLWVFGNAMNYKFGHLGYIGLFVLAALVSGLAHYATSDLAVVGASGAIYGVMGAFLVFFPRNDVKMIFWLFAFIRYFTISSIWMILLWVGWDVFYMVRGAETGVAHWAHMGGFIAGFALAMVLAARGIVRSDADEQTLLEMVRSSR